MTSAKSADAVGILLEAEDFDEYGGWLLDSQFDHEMGSPYLLAHGLGRPVADATTTVAVPEAGRYHLWVRAKDWVPAHHPGRFQVTINGAAVEREFGANGQNWSWEPAGIVDLDAGDATIALHDLTGFDGRCDAIFLGRDDTPPPEGAGPDARSWRRRLRGLPDEPTPAGEFDVVIAGGGITGVAAALTAARLGCRVALIQDRPYLGGNASVEIGLSPRGETGPLINELSQRNPDGDLHARRLLQSEPNATVVMEQTVYDAATDGRRITSIDARDARSGQEYRYTAPIFIDCTGTALLGILSGAQTRFGQEAHDEFDESLAPEHGDDMHHGNTVFFRTRMADTPASFPAVPWAHDVAKDFADLRGQLTKPGIENGPGPVAGPFRMPDPTVRRRMTQHLTHFWEYGQWLDPYTNGEAIRDHLLCAIYGTFANVKRIEPREYANLELDWVAYVPAQGEYRRYVGDYTLTETDIRSHKHFPDAVVQNSGAFCLHYPGDEKYDFRLKNWIWDTRDEQPYDIPFRCLYSVDIENLMVAGKHISVTHVAGSNTKFMGNGGQHGIATAAAAFLCTKYSATPRDIYQGHLQELQDIARHASTAPHRRESDT